MWERQRCGQGIDDAAPTRARTAVQPLPHRARPCRRQALPGYCSSQAQAAAPAVYHCQDLSLTAYAKGFGCLFIIYLVDLLQLKEMVACSKSSQLRHAALERPI